MTFGHKIRGVGSPRAYRGFWYGLAIGAAAWAAFAIVAFVNS